MDKMTDDEIEDFARRMGETGAREIELADFERWRDFVNHRFRGTELLGATPGQLGLAEAGRSLYEAGLKEAGLRLAPGGRWRRYKGGVKGWEVYKFRYRDKTTGQFMKAVDAYYRRQFLGYSTPRSWKYPSFWIPG